MKKALAPAVALGFAAAGFTAAGTAQAAPGVYYPNCKAAIAAHAAPIKSWEPGYRSGLDRDGDGTACDKNLPVGYVKKSQPAPVKPAPTKPVPAKPAPVVQAPATHAPTQPAPAKPGAPAAGPVVQTDYVKTTDGAVNAFAAFALIGAAGSAAALRVRALKR